MLELYRKFSGWYWSFEDYMDDRFDRETKDALGCISMGLFILSVLTLGIWVQ